MLLNICSVKFPDPPFSRNPAVVVFTTFPEMIWLGARTSSPVGPENSADDKLWLPAPLSISIPQPVTRGRIDLAAVERAIAVYAAQRIQKCIDVRQVAVAVVSGRNLYLAFPSRRSDRATTSTKSESCGPRNVQPLP